MRDRAKVVGLWHLPMHVTVLMAAAFPSECCCPGKRQKHHPAEHSGAEQSEVEDAHPWVVLRRTNGLPHLVI